MEDENMDYIDRDEKESFYGEAMILLEGAINELMSRIQTIRHYYSNKSGRDPIEHCKSRIKSEASMKEKLSRKGFPVTSEAALTKVFDAAGIRIICPFVDDVYLVVNMLHNQKDLVITEEKDYIRNAKENGYRSYHMITKVPVHLDDGIIWTYVEVQIRTIAMDCWASLEHQLHYKKADCPNNKLIVGELKRCSDEIANTDLKLQTIRDLMDQMEEV